MTSEKDIEDIGDLGDMEPSHGAERRDGQERREVVTEIGRRGLATREHPRSAQLHYPMAPQARVSHLLPDDLVAAVQPYSERAEEFRALRTELLASLFALPGKRGLAVLSQDDGDGKSYLAANLAVSLSQAGGRTLLVDGNFRRPGLHRFFALEPGLGLTDMLAGRVPDGDAIGAPRIDGLHLLQAGAPLADPVHLLQSPVFAMLMQQLLAQFEYVLVDTPSNAAGPEGRILAAQVGAAIVVGRQGRTRIAALRKLLEQLDTSPAELAGVVFNRH